MNFSWKKTGQLLLLIVLLATILRFYHLGTNSFVADEFLDMNSAYGYSKTGDWKAWDFNFGKTAEMNVNAARDERAGVYKAQVATLFHFLAPTEGAARTVSVIWGIGDILLIFWVTSRFTGKKEIGLLAAFLLAVSISALTFDRRLRMYAMFAPVYLALSWTLFEWLEGRTARFGKQFEKLREFTGLEWVYVLPVLALGVLSIQVHLLTVNILPVLGLYLMTYSFLVWKRQSEWKNKYTGLIILGLLGFIAVSLIRPKLVGTLLGSFTFFDNHYSYFGYITENFWHPLLGFLLILAGSGYLARFLGKKKEAVYLSLSFWVPLLLATFFWKRNEGPQYIFFAQSFGLILGSIGMYGLLEWIYAQIGETKRSFQIIILIGALLLIPNWAYFFADNNTYHETSSSSNPNYRKVFGYVVKQREATDVLVTRNFRNYYWSGAKIPVADFGGELSTKTERLTVDMLKSLQSQYPTGWVVLSGNDLDYVSNEAEVFLNKDFDHVSNSSVRGDIFVYHWGASTK